MSSSEDDSDDSTLASPTDAKTGTLRFTCLICLEKIGKTVAVWNCKFCRCTYHLQCSQQWAQESIQKYAMDAEDLQLNRSYSQSSERTVNCNLKKATWCCPKCRSNYQYKDLPKEYTCFCEKVINPSSDRWLTPHSCGATCERLLPCQHKCRLLCHSGLCPPCPVTIEKSCFCGKRQPKALRCAESRWSCQSSCGKLLSCGLHRCSAICHDGECSTCSETFSRRCGCGTKIEQRPCGEKKAWSCGSICNAPLPCGKHNCQMTCHDGSCLLCVMSNRSCPCGKMVYQEIGECIDEMKCCGDTCGKLLDCGLHTCVERCHKGPCGTCVQIRLKRCRCGLKEKKYPCGKELLCDIKCKYKRSCGKHLCNRKCCPGPERTPEECSPLCEQTCGRTLQCLKHKCNQTCHRGPCYPCILTADVRCRCGTTAIKVPCGSERNYKPPKCLELCKISPVCKHSMRQPHRCHFGDCPPCKQICNLDLPCGHKCQRICHKGLLIDVNYSATKKAASPWEKIQPRFELVDKPCPPCEFPVSAKCIGGHVTELVPCHRAQFPFDCGRSCQRLLTCGNHRCQLQCHTVPTKIMDSDEASPTCDVCDDICSLSRPTGCIHRCPLPCHPIPCPECRLMVKIMCYCKLNEKLIPCNEWRLMDKQKRVEIMSCGNQCPKLMSCGHPCTFTCHFDSCSTSVNCKKRLQIRCRCGRKTAKIMCFQKANQNRLLDCDDDCQKSKDYHQPSIDVCQDKKIDSEVLDSTNNANLQQNLARRRRKKKDRNETQDDQEKTWIPRQYGNFFKILIITIVVVAIMVYYFLTG